MLEACGSCRRHHSSPFRKAVGRMVYGLPCAMRIPRGGRQRAPSAWPREICAPDRRSETPTGRRLSEFTPMPGLARRYSGTGGCRYLLAIGRATGIISACTLVPPTRSHGCSPWPASLPPLWPSARAPACRPGQRAWAHHPGSFFRPTSCSCAPSRWGARCRCVLKERPIRSSPSRSIRRSGATRCSGRSRRSRSSRKRLCGTIRALPPSTSSRSVSSQWTI